MNEKNQTLRDELTKLALQYVEEDCAVSSILFGALAAVKCGASHELAIYLIDFSREYLSPAVKKKLQVDLDAVKTQVYLAKRSLERKLNLRVS